MVVKKRDLWSRGKKGNATAIILIVLLLLLGASVLTFKPFIPRENNVDYQKYIAAGKSYIERNNDLITQKMMRDGFLSRVGDDLNYWYCNYPLFQDIDYSIDEAEGLFLQSHVIKDEEIITNVSLPGAEISREMEFSLENFSIHISSRDENRTILVNGSFSRPDLADLFNAMNTWLECNAGQMTQNIEGEMGGLCQFAKCTCETTLDYDPIIDSIIDGHGLEKNQIRESVTDSIEKLNWILNGGSCEYPGGYPADFVCEPDFDNPAGEFFVDNHVSYEYESEYSCAEDRFDDGFFPYGDTALFQEWTPEDGIERNFRCLTSTLHDPIQTNLNPREGPPEKYEEPGPIAVPAGFFFYLHKRTGIKIPVKCYSEKHDQEASFWIYVSVENKCREEPRPEDAIGGSCGGGDGDGGGGIECPNCQVPVDGECVPMDGIECVGPNTCMKSKCINFICTEYEQIPDGEPCPGEDPGKCFKLKCLDGECQGIVRDNYYEIPCNGEDLEYGCKQIICSADGSCDGEPEVIPTMIDEVCDREHLTEKCKEYRCSDQGMCDVEDNKPIDIHTDPCAEIGECLDFFCDGQGSCDYQVVQQSVCEKSHDDCDGTCMSDGYCDYPTGACTVRTCNHDIQGTCNGAGRCIYDSITCCESDGISQICESTETCCYSSSDFCLDPNDPDGCPDGKPT